MYLAMSIAASGLSNQMRRIDTIANNIANVNTAGFKNARLDFKDSLYTTGITPGPPRTPAPEGNQQKGHGVMVAAITRDFRPAHVERTDRNLDFAIENEGFFSFSSPTGDGEIFYSRNGAFNLSVEETGIYLVNGEGLYLLDVNENRIEVPVETSVIASTPDGIIRFISDDVEIGNAAVGMYTFRNIMGLELRGNSTYVAVPSAGERRFAENAVLRQGVIEGSNVDLGEEMTRVIRTQRAFQLASRALTTADEMQGIANNMRR